MRHPILLRAMLLLLLAACVSVAHGQGQRRPEIYREKMHSEEVLTLAYSRGPAPLLATGSQDTTVKLYDVAGREIRTLQGHAGQVFQVAFSPDGRLLASASEDGTAALWDVRTGIRKFVLRGHGSPVTSAAFSPDGRLLATGGQDGNVRLWTVATGVEFKMLPGHEGYVTAVAFHSIEASLLASGGTDGTIRIWDAARGTPKETLKGHEGTVNALGFSPRERGPLASAGLDTNVILWDTQTWLDRAPRRGHDSGVNALAFSRDGSLLASGGDDAKLLLWDTLTGREPRPLVGHSIKVKAVDFGPDGKSLASAGSDETIRFWDPANGNSYRTLAIASYPFNQLALSPDGRLLAVGIREVKLWRVGEAQSSQTLNGGGATFITGLAFSADGGLLATTSEDGAVKLWDPRTGAAAAQLGVHSTRAVMLALSRDGRRLASVGDDGEVKVWDVEARAGLYSFSAGPAALTAIALSRAGETLALGYANGDVRLLRGSNGSLKALAKAPPRTPIIAALAFSDDGRFLATGDRMSSLSKVKLRDAATGRLLWVFAPKGAAPAEGARSSHDNDVLSLAFSPDSKKLYSASADATVKVWSVRGRRELLTFAGHGAPVAALALMQGGRLALSGSVDGEFVAWRTDDGAEAARLVPVGGRDWLITAPDGLFDGSAPAWKRVIWRFGGDTLDYTAVESFFGDFYRPGLFRNILDGKAESAPRTLADLDRRAPRIRISSRPGGDPAPRRRLELEVEAEEAAPGSGLPAGGVRDLRLFRNGSLVKVWRGESPKVLGRQDGCTLNADAQGGGRRVVCRASVTLVAGENRLSAYAFNRDNVKSEDAELQVYGDKSLERKGTLYVLAVGVDHYSNPDYDLSFAVDDADEFGRALKTEQEQKLPPDLRRYARVEVLRLWDADATRANILRALRIFSGAEAPALPADHPLAEARASGPEDALVIFFAGHGKATLSAAGGDEGELYLIPHDMGYAGPRVPLTGAAFEAVKNNSVSSADLRDALAPADAGLLVLVIDACNSGQALEMKDPRQGPMNSRGLAQLAYEKGMYILTASQGYESARESAVLNHGLLTHALVVEGLGEGAADSEPKDGEITLREWLDFAARRVPEIQAVKETNCRSDVECPPEKKGELIEQLELQQGQRPRVFYRRDPGPFTFVLSSPAGRR